ncbi:MAG: hypothetical protein JXR69_03715 [Candidatus Delongbacteria bacterium]|nr:hypothetical protein [Candidatus Delongbacteria bacterium]
MKKTVILLTVMILAVMINAQEAKIVGSWLMTKAEVGGDVQEPYYITEYQVDGKMIIMGMDAGTWKFNKEDNSIITESELDKDFNGESKIIKNTDAELIMTKDEAKLFYIKIDQDKIKLNNLKSGLFGLWKFNDNDGYTNLLKFTEPDEFVMISYNENETSTTNGTWIFDPKENSLTMLGFNSYLKGKNNIMKITASELTIDCKGTVLNAVKDNSDAGELERLTFVYEDFEEEQISEISLPWVDLQEMINYLKSVKYLKYSRGVLIEKINAFKKSTILSKVIVDEENYRVNFTNFSLTKNDTTEISDKIKDESNESDNIFFPEEKLTDYDYKIIGVEDVEVPAGKFTCTVTEGFNGEDKVKYWMINDKPGVYAKTIVEKSSPFGDLEYILTELEEIK